MIADLAVFYIRMNTYTVLGKEIGSGFGIYIVTIYTALQ